MRNGLVVLWMFLWSITPAAAQVSVGIGLPSVSIGINLPVYPQLVAVPGYPVYYAPQVSSNYFFYDGMYWVYQQDNWYASTWYNGPWGLVDRAYVPLYVLRVPVRYYRHPPAYFHGWRGDAPPRWGEHWGGDWERSHSGWDHWNRNAVPALAPLPVYQRQYSGSRYPQVEQQHVLQSQSYRYQPQDAVVQQHYQAQRIQSPAAPPPQRVQSQPAPQRMPSQPATPPQRTQDYRGAPAQPQAGQVVPQAKLVPQQESHGSSRQASPQPSAAPAQRPPAQQRGGGDVQRPAVSPAPVQQSAPNAGRQNQHAQQPAAQPQPQRAQQPAAQPQPQAPKAQGGDKQPQGKAPAAQEAKPGQGRGRPSGDQKAEEHNK
jgi:hypothetical protein